MTEHGKKNNNNNKKTLIIKSNAEIPFRNYSIVWCKSTCYVSERQHNLGGTENSVSMFNRCVP